MRYTKLKEENKTLKILLVLMALIISLTLGLLLGEGEFEVEQRELKLYAEMVCLDARPVWNSGGLTLSTSK